MDVVALIISIFALVVSYTSVVFGKNLEIKVKKFDELVLEELKSKFRELDDLFENRGSDVLSIHLTKFTDIYVEIVIYLIAAKYFFPGINVNTIQDELHQFSDKLYEKSMTTISEEKSNYQIHKLKTMSLIYDQSIKYASRWNFITHFK